MSIAVGGRENSAFAKTEWSIIALLLSVQSVKTNHLVRLEDDELIPNIQKARPDAVDGVGGQNFIRGYLHFRQSAIRIGIEQP